MPTFVLDDVLQDVSNNELIRGLMKHNRNDIHVIDFVRKNVRVEKCLIRNYEFLIESKKKGMTTRVVERRSFTIDIPGVTRRHFDSYKSIYNAVVTSMSNAIPNSLETSRQNTKGYSLGKVLYWMYETQDFQGDLPDLEASTLNFNDHAETICSNVAHALKKKNLRCPFMSDGKIHNDNSIFADIFWGAPELVKIIAKMKDS